MQLHYVMAAGLMGDAFSPNSHSAVSPREREGGRVAERVVLLCPKKRAEVPIAKEGERVLAVC
jgi:hypothetical protein